MAQKLNFQKETLDNLDRVEPYGNTAAARAASETANMYARTSQQFTRLLGRESEKQAKQQALNATFKIDPETGVPMLPEYAVRIGSWMANETYQQTLDIRYEDSLNSALQTKMKEASINNLYDEEGFRQETAVLIGAMYDKVRPEFQQVFLDNATQLNAKAAGDIAYRVAMEERAKARAASRRSGSRLARQAIIDAATPEDREALLEEITRENPGLEVLHSQSEQEYWTTVNKLINDRIVDEYRNSTTGAPERAVPEQPTEEELKTEAEVKTVQEENKQLVTQFEFNKSGESELATEFARYSDQSLDEFQTAFTGLTDAQRDKRFEAALVSPDGINANEIQFWTNPQNLNPENYDPSQQRLLGAIHEGYVPSILGQGLSRVASGDAGADMIDAMVFNWSVIGNDMEREGTWANKNPEAAGAMDAIASLARDETRRYETPEEREEALQARGKAAKETTNEKLGTLLGMDVAEGEKVTLSQIEDEVRRRIESNIRGNEGYTIDPYRLEELTKRTIGNLRASQTDEIDAYISDMLSKNVIEEEGFLSSTGDKVHGLYYSDYPRLNSAFGTHGTAMMRTIAARTLTMMDYPPVDPDDVDELAFQPLGNGEYGVFVNGEETILTLNTKDLQPIIDSVEATYQAEQLPIARELQEQIIEMQREIQSIQRTMTFDEFSGMDQLDGVDNQDKQSFRIKELNESISNHKRRISEITFGEQGGPFTTSMTDWMFNRGTRGMLDAAPDELFIGLIDGS